MSRLTHSHQPSMDQIEAQDRCPPSIDKMTAWCVGLRRDGDPRPGEYAVTILFDDRDAAVAWANWLMDQEPAPAAERPCPRCGEMRDADVPEGPVS